MAKDDSARRLATTHWSVVLAAGDTASPQSRAALADLCETYWPAVYGFVRRSGHSSEDARDLTQAFFTRLLDKHWLRDVRPDRGGFRAFLFTALRHFLANERDWLHALKRGGGAPVLSIEVDDGEHRYLREPVEQETPDLVYERRWALAALDAAMRRLTARQAGHEHREWFERLKPLIAGDGDGTPYRALAAELGTSEGALRVTVHRLRHQFAESLRETIAETVEHEADVADEIRYLLEVLRR